MPLFRIADIIVDMSPKYEETASWYEPYRIADNAEPQLTVTANDKEITYFVNKGVDITPPISENMVFCDKFNRSLIQFDGCYIHSSALKFDDKVYLSLPFPVSVNPPTLKNGVGFIPKGQRLLMMISRLFAL